MNRERRDVAVEDLGDGIRRLCEFGFVNCFLVEGSEKACLIDAGVGIAEMDAVVRSLTDKPLVVLITHAHADHVGGAVWFPEVRIHPADLKRGRIYAHPAARLYFLACHRYKRVSHGVRFFDAFQRKYKPAFRLLEDGETIDLGGREITCVLTPGHSPGSVIFRDSLTGTVFAGDNVNPMVTLHYPGGTTVRTWIDGAERTLETAAGATIWGGHGDSPVAHETIREAIGLARSLTAAGNGTSGKTGVKKGPEKYPRILYKKNRIV